MRHNVFVIETARDAYGTVTVLTYEKGKPQLAVQETVRDPAVIAVIGGEVQVTVSLNDGRSRTYSFTLVAD
jgi:hypothetical protein